MNVLFFLLAVVCIVVLYVSYMVYSPTEESRAQARAFAAVVTVAVIAVSGIHVIRQMRETKSQICQCEIARRTAVAYAHNEYERSKQEVISIVEMAFDDHVKVTANFGDSKRLTYSDFDSIRDNDDVKYTQKNNKAARSYYRAVGSPSAYYEEDYQFAARNNLYSQEVHGLTDDEIVLFEFEDSRNHQKKYAVEGYKYGFNNNSPYHYLFGYRSEDTAEMILWLEAPPGWKGWDYSNISRFTRVWIYNEKAHQVYALRT